MAYNTFIIEDMDFVRSVFGEGDDLLEAPPDYSWKAFDEDPRKWVDYTMNWCFCSTSGTHGSYGTIDDEMRTINNGPYEPDEEEYSNSITVTIVKPRQVQIGSGHITVTREDLLYLNKLVVRTISGVIRSQEGNV